MRHSDPHPVMTILALLLAAAVPVVATSVEMPAAPGDTATDAPTSAIVAYYLHGNARCATCRKLEAYSEEAITKGFPDELASGQLAWRVVNTDEPENRHFVTDFELVTKSLVLVEYRDGKVVRFENLKLIWQLVKDQDGFLTYVRDATREFIGES